MYILPRIALCGAAVATYASASAPKGDYSQQLANLLIDKGKPTVAELDKLEFELYKSFAYQGVSKVGKVSESELSGLFASVVPPSVSRDKIVVTFGPGDDHDDPKPKMRGVDLKSSDVRAMGAAYDMLPAADPVGPVGAALDPTSKNYQSMQYIMTTVDTLTHLLVVLNRVDADMKAEDYVDVVQAFDAEFNVILAQLANQAIDRLSLSSDSAKAWKDAIWQLHLLVANYVSDKKGLEDWAAFKAQVTAGLTKLVDFAVVAKATDSSSAVPAAGASNAQLTTQLKQEAVSTGCLCIWKCLFRICGSASDVATTTPLPTTLLPGFAGTGIAAPDASAVKAIQTVLFIESSVAALQSIVREIEALNASGPDGQERIRNLELRVALRITNIIKQALINNAFDGIYEKLKSRSVLLLGTMTGIATSTSWDSVRANIQSAINAIMVDLNASKPAGVV